MGSQGPKSARSLKPSYSNSGTPTASRSSSLSSHLAMVELKQRILTSLSKLADRDTHHIALEELESTISTLQNDAVPMLLNCLFDASSSDPKSSVKKEALRVIGTLAASHPETTSTHLVKIVAHIAKRLRDPDNGIRDACRDTIGNLSGIYLRGTTAGEHGVVSLFVRPLFEAMGENNKGVQIGASVCLGRVVECAENPPISSLQKLCPRICKFLNSPSFFAKSSLLPVIATLSQVGAIAPQSLDPLLQSLHECFTSTDWATRKAAADTLRALAMHSRVLVKDSTESTITALEASKFDKIKPVRDSMSEALQLWKKVAGIGEEGSVDRKTSSSDAEKCGSLQSLGKNDRLITSLGDNKSFERSLSNANGSITDSSARSRNGTLSEKAVGLLKKKVPPGLTDKELNPEFFQKLEKSGTGDMTVEVVVSRKCVSSSNPLNADTEQNGADTKGDTDERNDALHSKQRDLDGSMVTKPIDDPVNGKHIQGGAFEHDEKSLGFMKADGSFMNNKGNWLAIQRQLLHLERQQTNLMNMLQDFMGGSHDSMITLENRVRSLERVVEDMVHDLSLSSGRRGNNISGFEGSSSRSVSRYNGFFDYSSKFGRGGGDGRLPLDGMRGRGPSWKSDLPDSWDFQPYGGASRSGQVGSRRDVDGSHMDGRSPKFEPDNEQASGRRAWVKGAGPVRLGEGPSARSVWQASKDEATLAAIRVAGDDNVGTVQRARVAIPEMTAEAMGDDENGQQERDPVRIAWGNTMDALHVGDIDSAYAEVLEIGDDFFLVKLMDRTGPALDQLTNEVAVDVLSSLVQLMMDQNLFDLCFSWVQQLVDIIIENGPEVFGIPMEVRRELLVNFHHASSTIDLPDDWEGGPPEQLVLQLASAWEINLQHGN